MLLHRDIFRESVFERDGYSCVVCGAPAQDAHHIIERRLFPDGGYYLNNGASVCGQHHLECEMTTISVEDIRDMCGIKKIVIPPHLYSDQPYDKWGNPILSNGTRAKGELFHDESVQKILRKGRVLDLFVDYVKYPRTYHLPWSESISSDDRVIESTNIFEGKEVVVTEKMDGENTTMYRDYIHARSVDGRSHPSRDRVKAIWGNISHNIPHRWRVCGENLYAKHSIYYKELPSYLLGFSIWNENNECLSWSDTIEWLELIEIRPVNVLFEGVYDEGKMMGLWNEGKRDVSEGYVVRLKDSFHYSEFSKSVAKFVRSNHVTTDQHWMRGKPITPNKVVGK